MTPFRAFAALLSIISLSTTSSSWAEEVAPGVTYTLHELSGPVKAHVVTVDRLRAECKLKVGWPEKRRDFSSRQTVSTIAGLYDDPPDHDALAAVNASFFDSAPIITGTAASDGEILEPPTGSYDTFLFGPTRRPVIVEDIGHANGTVTFANGTTTTLHRYNKTRVTDTAVAYTPQWAPTSTTTLEGVEVILSQVSYPMRGDKAVSGVVSAIKTGPASVNNAIPAGGMVLSVRGSPESIFLANTSVGDRLSVFIDTTASNYNNADMAITGIGYLVKNGAAYTSNWSQYSSSFVNSRHPRTVLASNETHLFLIAIDGRSSASIGMSFAEMADFLINTLSATEGVNLDGGGSTTMWVDGTVRNDPSDGSERAVANAVLLVKEDTSTTFPFADSLAASGRLAGWDDKFTYNDVVAFSPASPGGDGYVIKVADPAGGVETVRRGDFGDADCVVQADVYCEYRPDLAGDGYERYGIFARDSGTGAFGLASFGGGDCYALTCDSDSGRIRAGKYVNGTLTDFREADPYVLPSTAWRRFRIECRDTGIRYCVDGTEIANVTDTTFARGYFGIGYHERFTTNSNMHGTRADNFSADLPSPPPGKATAPEPENLAANVSISAQLTWTAGSDATSHRVQVGTTSPGIYRGTQTDTTFDPGPLSADLTCYWRIDEVNDAGTTTGDVWQFTTQPETAHPDFDGDGDVDMEDFGHFQVCLTGPFVPQSNPDCLDARLDGDNDVDQSDFFVFQACMSGPDLPAPPGCAGSIGPSDPIPPRPPEAMSGSEFITDVLDLALYQREARILEEITAGNIPDFLRSFVPINVSATIGGTTHNATYEVMPDYLCIGSDADFVRMPMTPATAQAIADRFECVLPTRKMVDDIYSQAAVKLAPSPIDPGTTNITLVSVFYQHHLTIEGQRAGNPLGLLVGGIKKDVVVTPQLITHPNRVAIYGWHQLSGVPIQPLYLGHVDSYVDYSHGIRLVKGYMTLDGSPVSVADLLRRPDLHVLLSDEGTVDHPRY